MRTLETICPNTFKVEGCLQIYCPDIFGHPSLQLINRHYPLLTDGDYVYIIGKKLISEKLNNDSTKADPAQKETTEEKAKEEKGKEEKKEAVVEEAIKKEASKEEESNKDDQEVKEKVEKSEEELKLEQDASNAQIVSLAVEVDEIDLKKDEQKPSEIVEPIKIEAKQEKPEGEEVKPVEESEKKEKEVEKEVEKEKSESKEKKVPIKKDGKKEAKKKKDASKKVQGIFHWFDDVYVYLELENEQTLKLCEFILYEFDITDKKGLDFIDQSEVYDKELIQELYESFSGYFTFNECARALSYNKDDIQNAAQWLVDEGDRERNKMTVLVRNTTLLAQAEVLINSLSIQLRFINRLLLIFQAKTLRVIWI